MKYSNIVCGVVLFSALGTSYGADIDCSRTRLNNSCSAINRGSKNVSDYISVGGSFQDGEYGEVDYSIAQSVYLRGLKIEPNNPCINLELGRMSLRGQGVAVNKEKATQYFKVSASTSDGACAEQARTWLKSAGK